MKTHFVIALVMLAAMAVACRGNIADSGPDYTESGLNPDDFCRVIDGDTTALFTLTNAEGMEVCITNYGAHIVSMMVPARDDVMRDVVLGMDSVGAYFPSANAEIGAVMGRYAGRLKRRPSAKSNEWMHRVYRVAKATENELTLRLYADSLDDGMPGNVAVQLDYVLTDDNTLDLTITAISDAVTPVDIAPRLFFNLDGTTNDKLTGIAGHRLQMSTDQYLVRDSLREYPGDMLMTIWTPFSFAKERKIGQTLNADFHQVKRMDGIEGYFVMPDYGESYAEMLRLYSPDSGIEMTISTSLPGVELYTANRFDGSIIGKHGVSYGRRTALAIMPHSYPHAIERPGWGIDAYLRPGQVLREKISYHFSVSDR